MKRKIFDNKTFQSFLIMAIVFFIMSIILGDKFVRYYNFESIMYVFPELGLLTIAIMISMLTGGIDLSIVAIANLCGILAGKYFNSSINDSDNLTYVIISILIIFVASSMMGLLNGIIITKFGVTPILATMGSGMIFTGISLVITGGPSIVGFPEKWIFIGNGKLLKLPVPLIIFFVISTVFSILILKTSFGIKLKLIGTNTKAAIYSGINVKKIVTISYMLTGLLSGISGVMMSARTAAAKSDFGTSYLLQAVLIAVLAGTDPAGGKGNVWGILFALLSLMFLSSGFQIMRFSNFTIDMIWSIFLIIVMLINQFQIKKY